MSFWKTLGKIATFAAPIIAAPFTGGTSLALLGAGAGAANAALSGKGVGGILTGAALGSIPGLGKAASGVGQAAKYGTAYVGAPAVGGAVSSGSRLASLLTAAPKILGGLSSAVGTVDQAAHGGVTGAQAATQRGVVAGSMADQAANNRLRETQVGQAGPAVDAQALTNVRTAGRLANYTPPPASVTQGWDTFGKRLPPVDPTTIKFAGDMQAELARRLAAGQPLTLSGVPAAGAQEQADNAAARAAAEQGGQSTAGTVQNVLTTGAQLAKLAPTFADILRQFQRKKTVADQPVEDPYDGTHGGF